jgi:ribosomal protein S18 acetylase RimI-like enzyme
MAPFDVSPAAPHELLPACRLLFPDGRVELCRDRLLADADTSALFVARGAGGRLHAAACVQTLSGAAGVIIPPRGDSGDALDAVTVPACAWLRARGVKVCQAFATVGRGAEAAPLERHGFYHVTQLVFLQRAVGEPFDCAGPRLNWTAWPQRPTPAELDLLLATHEGTLDCPELNAARTADEILAGFQPNNCANRMWWTCRDETDAPVGVLLFLGGAGDSLEASYLGLVPSARGRGLANAIIEFAVRVAFTAGYPALGVSVDVRNVPAMKLYARHRFAEYDRNEVWLASWPG